MLLFWPTVRGSRCDRPGYALPDDRGVFRIHGVWLIPLYQPSRKVLRHWNERSELAIRRGVACVASNRSNCVLSRSLNSSTFRLPDCRKLTVDVAFGDS